VVYYIHKQGLKQGLNTTIDIMIGIEELGRIEQMYDAGFIGIEEANRMITLWPRIATTPVAPRLVEEAPSINYGSMTDEELMIHNNMKKRLLNEAKYRKQYFESAKRDYDKAMKEVNLQRANHGHLNAELAKRRADGNIKLVCPPTKTKVLSKAKLEENMVDVCGVCMETHIVADTLTTGCNHQFGKNCFGKWAAVCLKGNAPISCPMCKCRNPKIYDYRARAAPKPRVKPPVVGKPAPIIIDIDIPIVIDIDI